MLFSKNEYYFETPEVQEKTWIHKYQFALWTLFDESYILFKVGISWSYGKSWLLSPSEFEMTVDTHSMDTHLI